MFGIILGAVILFATMTSAQDLTIQAESMNLSNYAVEGGNRIRLTAARGTATRTFQNANGRYDILFYGISEAKTSRIELKINGALKKSLTYRVAPKNSRFKLSNIFIKKGQSIQIVGYRVDGGQARVDKIVFKSVTAEPPPAPTPAPTPTNSGGFAPHSPNYKSIIRGYACHGCDWTSYLDKNPSYRVQYITNLSPTNTAGSLLNCLNQPNDGTLLFCVVTVSGMMDAGGDKLWAVQRDNLVVMFQTAPSPGFHYRGVALRLMGNRQLWMHPSGFVEGTTQPTGTCIEYNGGNTMKSSIVVINPGCHFANDPSVNLWNNVSQSSFLHGLFAYPAGKSTGYEEATSFCAHIGPNNHSSDRSLGAYNVCAHTKGRQFKISGIRNWAFYNNVFYNASNNYTDIANGNNYTGKAANDGNLEGNLYINGLNTSPVLKTIRFLSRILIPTRVYISANEVFGFNYDASPQSNMISDSSGGKVSVVGSRIAPAHPPGFGVTRIAATDQGRKSFMQLVSNHAGPRPADRHPHYKLIGTQLNNRFNGSGNYGERIDTVNQHPLGGYPAIAQKKCEPKNANSCFTGMPALPFNDLKGLANHINKMWQYVSDTHCAVSNAGAIGCD